jgi:hypothetical protein
MQHLVHLHRTTFTSPKKQGASSHRIETGAVTFATTQDVLRYTAPKGQKLDPKTSLADK